MLSSINDVFEDSVIPSPKQFLVLPIIHLSQINYRSSKKSHLTQQKKNKMHVIDDRENMFILCNLTVKIVPDFGTYLAKYTHS